MNPKLSLRGRALNILSRQEISRAELARKLRPYVEESDDLTALLDELAQKHWQSDARFTETYIYSKSRQHGNMRLKQALKQKGVDEQLINDYLPDTDRQIENAINVLRKKFHQPPTDMRQKQKYMQFLAYRGYSMDIIYTALKQAWEDAPLITDDSEYESL
ncbi:recombination regulator RecX [Neisseriaceae bacterium ESL0693]|nr:recombination regulator RecX [Neisseriaceae bacterium ESL0693]